MGKVRRFLGVIFIGAILLTFVPAIVLHSHAFASSPPGGMWVTPANGQRIGNSIVLEASAYPTNRGEPAIAYVNFTGWYNGKWNIICQVTHPTYSNVYECPWTLKGVIIPGYVTISFDVYNQAGKINSAPNGMRSINYVPGTSPAVTAIAWAMHQLGSQNWNGKCEVFVENAFGTQYKFLTAQDAFTHLPTSTNGSPPIGALVFFKPNNGNGFAGHVGIYIGQNQFISATYNGVQINDMTSWSNNVATFEGWANTPSNWPGM